MKTTKGAKSKLTLSVRPRYVAMLRRASARRGQSITELVEEAARGMEAEEMTGKRLWADEVRNHKASFTDAEYNRTDLLGALLRKHMPK